MKTTLLLIAVFFICGCPPKNDCYMNMFSNITAYIPKWTMTTPAGYRLDTTDAVPDISLEILDIRLNNIEKCVLEVAKNNPVAKPEWACLGNKLIAEPIKKNCLLIKVVKPVMSKCSTWQHIPVKAPDQLCRDKGLEPTAECPCLWRVAVQDDNILITPPAMHLWDIVRIMTSCNGMWSSPLAACSL